MLTITVQVTIVSVDIVLYADASKGNMCGISGFYMQSNV